MHRKYGRNTDGTFAEGNPGRPKGSRNKATLAAMNCIDDRAEELSKQAIELALAGNTTALRLCLDRILPIKKDSAVTFDFPDVMSSGDIGVVASSVVKSIATGELTPLEGSRIMSVLETLRKSIETTELETRLSALEQTIGTSE